MATGQDGFVRNMTRHIALFYPRADRLIVTFDNMKSRDTPGPAYPWGYDLIAREGWSHLGLCMSRRNDWFRHPDVGVFFDELAQGRFFTQFSTVVFYGASMGGYGALTYSGAAPGARVVAFAPQTTLDPNVAAFETRFRSGFVRGDWSDPASDGALAAAQAAQVVVLADPFEAADAAHVARLPQHNLTWLKCPNMGHNPARVLLHMGLLPDVVRNAWDGALTASDFAQTIRPRRSRAQARMLLLRAINQGHSTLALRTIIRLKVSRPDWHFPGIAALAQQTAGGTKVVGMR